MMDNTVDLLVLISKVLAQEKKEVTSKTDKNVKNE